MIDPVLGIFKANIGVKDGLIVGVGRAGNPDIVDNPDLLIGSATAPIYGQGYIATPGGIDTHVHLVQPRLIPAALAAGMTTLITGGLNDNPAFNLEHMFLAFEHQPVNLGILGRAASYTPEPLSRQIESGACGLKVHEDYAGYPSIIDQALTVADAYDIQIAMHTDGINESCELHETVAAIAGRTHPRLPRGGHRRRARARTSWRSLGSANVIGSSTTPTIPYGRNVVAEHHAMMWSVHGMNPRVPSDREMIADRIRAVDHARRERPARAGGDQHHQLRLAGDGADRRGDPPHLAARPPDEAAARRRGRRTTTRASCSTWPSTRSTRPAPTAIDRWVGSLEPGKIADIVLWRPEFFGVKPELVIKGGYAAWGALGEGNASIPQSEPLIYAPHWGGQRARGGQPQRQLRLGRGGGRRLPPPDAGRAAARSR